MEVGEGFNQKSDIYPHWMAVHARLNNEFTEDEKCHNLMSWLSNSYFFEGDRNPIPCYVQLQTIRMTANEDYQNCYFM